jgi:hypothetical protein
VPHSTLLPAAEGFDFRATHSSPNHRRTKSSRARAIKAREAGCSSIADDPGSTPRPQPVGIWSKRETISPVVDSVKLRGSAAAVAGGRGGTSGIAKAVVEVQEVNLGRPDLFGPSTYSGATYAGCEHDPQGDRELKADERLPSKPPRLWRELRALPAGLCSPLPIKLRAPIPTKMHQCSYGVGAFAAQSNSPAFSADAADLALAMAEASFTWGVLASRGYRAREL